MDILQESKLENTGSIEVRSSTEDEETSTLLSSLRQRDSRNSRRRDVLIIAVLLVLGLSVFCNVILLFSQIQGRDLDEICSSYTQLYPTSPLSKDVKISYDTVDFNGKFFNETIYRQTPSPEVDDAWYDLGVEYHAMIIPEDEAERYGIHKGQVKRKTSQGGGYFANFEALHHLHCVNLLRQATYYNYPYYKKLGQSAFLNDEDILQVHIGHCLDILRQQIMCTADTGVFGQWWVKDSGPFTDFNTAHKCKNFDDIRLWAKEHQLADEDEPEFRPDDVLLPEIP